MIPAPGTVTAPDAELLRAAEISVALQQVGAVLITRECLALWPSLARLDLAALVSGPGRRVHRWDDPQGAGIRLRVEQLPYRPPDQYTMRRGDRW